MTKIKTAIILAALTATVAFGSSTTATNSAVRTADTVRQTGGQAAVVNQQQTNNGNTGPRSIGNNRNRTNWSKIKDMFM